MPFWTNLERFLVWAMPSYQSPQQPPRVDNVQRRGSLPSSHLLLQQLRLSILFCVRTCRNQVCSAWAELNVHGRTKLQAPPRNRMWSISSAFRKSRQAHRAALQNSLPQTWHNLLQMSRSCCCTGVSGVQCLLEHCPVDAAEYVYEVQELLIRIPQACAQLVVSALPREHWACRQPPALGRPALLRAPVSFRSTASHEAL
mmetsp:Transcript_58297/g.104371  ORF Transcript_58297/g.104371 Transcript_58297/m.104371 type:complete len:200 (+) Transcript_58297:168-767(+)